MPTTAAPVRTLATALATPALLVLATACALLTAAVALAGPAAAIGDPRRPAAEVTHGPSCGPGAVRVAVTNGTVPHRVALVLGDGREQDSAVLGPGERTELSSADVPWGRTVDVAVTVADAAGTAEQPLEFGTYTRPTAEDCAAISAPATTGATSTPATTPEAIPTPDGGPLPAGATSAAEVPRGGVVTVRATGFDPGEPVTVSLLGVEDPLTTVTAEQDGSVEAVVQIPRAAALGDSTVQLVGGLSSATAGLDLQVAARTRPAATGSAPLPVSAAGVALLGTAGMLGLVAARRSRGELALHHGALRHGDLRA